MLRLTKLIAKPSFLAFGLTVVCFVATYLYYDFYYVEYETLFDSFYSGSLTEGMPFRSIYFLGHIGISHFYSMLYQYYPSVEWMSWILYSYLFISCWIGLYIVLNVLSDRMLCFQLLAALLVYLLVFADHNIHFIFTRVSYMVSGLALIGLVYFFRDPGSIRTRKWLFIFLNFWFVIGTLTRSESSVAACLQVACFAIFYLYDLKRFALLFIFPFIFLLTVLAYIGYDIRTSTEFYKQIEPDIEAQYTDRDNVVPLAMMKTRRDSAQWQAARDIIWSDPRVLSPSYLRSLVLPERPFYTDARQWRRVFGTLKEIGARFWFLGLTAFILSLGVLLLCPFPSRFSYIVWLGFAVSFWVLIALQTYTDKVNDRSFVPLISLFILCHIIIILPYFRGLSWRTISIGGPLLVFFAIHIHYLNTESAILRRDLGNYQSNLSAIKKVARGKILAINSSTCYYVFSCNKPFHRFDYSDFKKVYITDGYNMPFLPYYRRYLERECHCNMMEFPSFWTYLRSRKEEVVILSIPRRLRILQEYMNAVHGCDISFHAVPTAGLLRLEESDFRSILNDLYIYKIN
jgi:hypothetical protein